VAQVVKLLPSKLRSPELKPECHHKKKKFCHCVFLLWVIDFWEYSLCFSCPKDKFYWQVLTCEGVGKAKRNTISDLKDFTRLGLSKCEKLTF
jgi:hypothetical protein